MVPRLNANRKGGNFAMTTPDPILIKALLDTLQRRKAYAEVAGAALAGALKNVVSDINMVPREEIVVTVTHETDVLLVVGDPIAVAAAHSLRCRRHCYRRSRRRRYRRRYGSRVGDFARDRTR